MQDPTFILYAALKREFPPPMESFHQELTESLEEIQTKIKTFPPEYKKIVWELRDCLDALAGIKAQHAFTLGLDFGLSLMEELRPAPDIIM